MERSRSSSRRVTWSSGFGAPAAAGARAGKGSCRLLRSALVTVARVSFVVGDKIRRSAARESVATARSTGAGTAYARDASCGRGGGARLRRVFEGRGRRGEESWRLWFMVSADTLG